MLIGLINQLTDIEESKEEAEQVLMQLFAHEEDYQTLCHSLEEYVRNKRLESIAKKKERMQAVIDTYGATIATCVSGSFPKILTKGKKYNVIYAEGTSHVTDSYLFDDNYDLRPINNELLKHQDTAKVRVLRSISRPLNIDKLLTLGYTLEEFNRKVI